MWLTPKAQKLTEYRKSNMWLILLLGSIYLLEVILEMYTDTLGNERWKLGIPDWHFLYLLPVNYCCAASNCRHYREVFSSTNVIEVEEKTRRHRKRQFFFF